MNKSDWFMGGILAGMGLSFAVMASSGGLHSNQNGRKAVLYNVLERYPKTVAQDTVYGEDGLKGRMSTYNEMGLDEDKMAAIVKKRSDKANRNWEGPSAAWVVPNVDDITKILYSDKAKEK